MPWWLFDLVSPIDTESKHMSQKETVSVLFVCMGNICRSPTAESVFRHRIDAAGLSTMVSIDSAGTHAYHIGNPPDARSQEAALRRGYRMDDQQARQVTAEDIARFDHVLAMDQSNLEILRRLAGASLSHKPRLFMSYAPHFGIDEVPDPYYGGNQGFEQVLDMIETASDALITELRQSLPR